MSEDENIEQARISLKCLILGDNTYRLSISNGEDDLLLAEFNSIHGFASLRVEHFEESLQEFKKKLLNNC